MKTALFVMLTLCAAWATSASAADDPQVTKIVHQVCAKCHGVNGISQASMFPRLAGQPADYIEAELRAMRDRTRTDPHAKMFMWPIAGTLTDQQIKGVAQYFAGQVPALGHTPIAEEQATRGERLYKIGDIVHDIPACAGCHGDQAEGNGAVPRLAGQHYAYLLRQIQDFRNGVRPNETMHENTASMSDDKAAALAQYLSALGPRSETEGLKDLVKNGEAACRQASTDSTLTASGPTEKQPTAAQQRN